jgi:hypothetical protein
MSFSPVAEGFNNLTIKVIVSGRPGIVSTSVAEPPGVGVGHTFSLGSTRARVKGLIVLLQALRDWLYLIRPADQSN